MNSISVVPGMASLAERYDGFIVDLWGVIHDGERLYPGVAETLQNLKKAGKPVCLLSNAPRRVLALEAGLEAMGIPRSLYDYVMCSGEAVHTELLKRTDPWFAALGYRCYHLGPMRDENLFEGLNLQRVGMEDADFVLNTGLYEFEDTVDTYMDVLVAARERSLPMLCANPDIVIVRRGQLICCAGAVAERYKLMGGEVVYRGKPDPAIYIPCLELLGISDRRRVAAVGDSFATDIAGAAAARIDSILVAGGIHAEELGLPPENPDRLLPDPARVMAACHKRALSPVAAIPAFVW